MKSTHLLSCFLFCVSLGFTQSHKETYSNLLSTDNLEKHLSVLASDSFMGRGTGKEGQFLAADYLKNYYKQLSIAFPTELNSYFQDYPLVELSRGGSIAINETKCTYQAQFILANSNFHQSFSKFPVYALQQVSPTTKDSCFVALFVEGKNIDLYIKSIQHLIPTVAKGLLLVTPHYKKLIQYYSTKTRIVPYSGKKGVEFPWIIVSDSLIKSVQQHKIKWFFNNKPVPKKQQQIPLFTIEGNLNPNQKSLIGRNVLAFIPGEDEKLADEVIVLSAHYDHLGVINGVVYNGADDDGTGTVALMEIAAAFQQAKKDGYGNKRSLLFIHFSGEELGLFGSSYYTTNPVLPLSKTITNLNIDMIGRNDNQHALDTNYIYIIGSTMLSTDLHDANEKANQHVQLKLDYTYNDKNDPNQYYYRSDHFNFAKNNIPSIFYFSGVHEDYHQPGDDVEKIIFPKLKKVAQLVFLTAWELANAPNRPVLNVK